MAEIDFNELPDGWTWITLEGCVDILDSFRVPINQQERDLRTKGKPESELYPYYGATGLVDYIDDYIFDGEHLLVGEDGAPFLDRSNPVAYIINGKIWVNNHAHVLRAIDGLTLNRYLCHYINTFDFTGYVTGTTRLKLNQANMKRIPIPLAPISEQHRIVDAIEAHFSQLDTWLAVMEKLREQLPRLRASILKAAVEGRLIAQHPNDEPADELLQRVLDERRRKWEQDYLAQHQAKGRTSPLFEDWKENYPEPIAPDFGDATDIPALPDGWAWASLDEIAAHEDNSITDGPFGSKLKTSHYTESGARVIRLQNIGDGEFLDDDKAFISYEHYRTLLKHRVFPDDIVIAALGDSLPRACIIHNGTEHAIVKADCMRFKPHSQAASPQYMNIALNSETVRAITSKRIHGIGRPRLNQTEIRSLPVPIPPRAQQIRIAIEVAERFSVIDRLLETIEVNIKRAERMRQSILKQAFEGRLVAQNPNDEPANELLERIQEEHERRAEEEAQKTMQPRIPKMSVQTGRKSLYETLKDAGKPLSASELFQQAGYAHETIDDFYEELREAVYESRTIRTRRQKNNEDVFLEVTG
jgi:type I restriction enzyme, S subunit